MKVRNIALYIGVVHQKNHKDDVADVRFISDSRENANQELIKVKEYAIKVLRLKVVIDDEDYILCQSIDEAETLESFYVERILIIRGVSK